MAQMANRTQEGLFHGANDCCVSYYVNHTRKSDQLIHRQQMIIQLLVFLMLASLLINIGYALGYLDPVNVPIAGDGERSKEVVLRQWQK